MSEPSSWADAKRIFSEALDLPREQRDAFVASACGAEEPAAGRGALAAGVARSSPPAFSKSRPPASAALSPDHHPLSGPRRHHGRRLARRSLVGAGGMGVVYRAERADAAFRRQVALKVIRPGSDRRRHRARGSRPSARRWPRWTIRTSRGCWTAAPPPTASRTCVMEFVDGVPIDRYCDEQRLPIDERLELFRTVCAGVQYAHENLVVHRDIKPDNILVTRDGMPKLLDFGVAKLARAAAGARSTSRGAAATWLMTPDYASPEQLGGAAEHHRHRRLLAGRAAVRAAHRRPAVSPALGTTPAGDREASCWTCTLIPPSRMALSAARAPRSGRGPPRHDTDAAGTSGSPAISTPSSCARMGREPRRAIRASIRSPQDLEHHRRRYPVARPRARTPATSPRRFVQRHPTALGVAATLVAGHRRRHRRRAVAGVAGHRGAGARRAPLRATSARWRARSCSRSTTRSTTCPAPRRRGADRAEGGASTSKAWRGSPPATPACSRSWRARSCGWATCRATRRAANVGDATGALHSYGRAMVIAEAVRAAAPGDRRCAADAGAGPPPARRRAGA